MDDKNLNRFQKIRNFNDYIEIIYTNLIKQITKLYWEKKKFIYS